MASSLIFWLYFLIWSKVFCGIRLSPQSVSLYHTQLLDLGKWLGVGQLGAISPLLRQMTFLLIESWQYPEWVDTSFSCKTFVSSNTSGLNGVIPTSFILGHTVLPLSPYSPEINPIEKAWGNLKKYLRKVLPNFNNFWDALLSYSGFN